MDIKTTPAQPAISLRVAATLSTLPQDVADNPEKLLLEASAAKLQQAGAMVFVYRNMSDDMQAPFELEIALPVESNEGYAGTAQTCTLAEFRFTETTHTGDLSTLGDSYQRLFGQIASAGLTLGQETREVYTHFVDSACADNVTHIQVGIAD